MLILFGSLLALLSLSSGILNTPIVNYRLGCVYHPTDPDFKPVFTLGKKMHIPIYGRPVKPMVLSSVKEVESLIKELTEVYKLVLGALPYNTMNKYIRFYSEYKNANTDFATFYRSYRPTFGPRETCVSLSVELLDQAHYRLRDKWPQLSTYTYIAAAKLGITKSLAVSMEKTWMENRSLKYPDSEHFFVYRELEHAMAALKIEVEGRQGYIVMDKGLYLERPVVLMFDGKYPHDAELLDYDTEDIYQFSLRMNNSYALWEYKPQMEERMNRTLDSNLIYLNRPYCSFQETTEKDGLLKGKRSLIMRDKDGKFLGGVYVRMLDANGTNNSVDVTLMYRNPGEREIRSYRMSLFKLTDAGMRELKTDTVPQLVNAISHTVGLSPNSFIDKLMNFWYISKDTVFVKGCEDMLKQINKHGHPGP